MKLITTIILLLNVLLTTAQNKVTVKIHSMTGYIGYEDFANAAAIRLETILNSKEFENAIVQGNFTETNDKTGQQVYDAITAADEGNGVDNVVDLKVRTINKEKDGRKWMRNCKPCSCAGTIGMDGKNGDGITATCPQWLKIWAENNDQASLAAHYAHEYMHKLGFKHNKNKSTSLVYQVGDIVEQLLSNNKLELLNGFDTFQTSDKTLDQANEAFEIISNAPIASTTCKEKANNCENKAAFSSYILNKLDFKPINFWIFKEGLIENRKDIGGLAYDTKTKKCKTLFWQYHVAAGIIINTDTLIFDPWTQGELVSLRKWALSFYEVNTGRTAFVLPVLGNYFYFPTTQEGKLITTKQQWQNNIDIDSNQMYCGLCGITPNKKCNKKKFKEKISSQKEAITKYLSDKGINP
jgi:hypothetical protein